MLIIAMIVLYIAVSMIRIAFFHDRRTIYLRDNTHEVYGRSFLWIIEFIIFMIIAVIKAFIYFKDTYKSSFK